MVSVLLATRNPNPKYFKLAVQSVLNQTYKDLELLIGFNDCEIMIPKINDERIRVFKYEEAGKGRTLNKLLEEAKGDIIGLQDDDDIWESNKLEVQMKVAADVVGSRIVYIDESGINLGSPKLALDHETIFDKSIKGINQMANTSVLFKKSDAFDVCGWAEDRDGIEDYDFWLKLMSKGCIFVNVPEILVSHRLHEKSNFNTKTHNIQGLIEEHGL